MFDTKPMSLHLATLDLIKRRPREIEYNHIAQACNIPVSWIEAYVAGVQKGPNVNRVQAVYEFLSKRTLVV